MKADLEELRAVKEGIGAAASEAAAEPEPDPEPEPVPEPDRPSRSLSRPVADEPAPSAPQGEGVEGARLIALNMALNGSPRDETARYLSENFQLDNPEALLDEVYARVSS